jgi:hypothetical protein
MKAWKYLILVGGLAGIIGFFLPFARAQHLETKIDQGVSAFQLVKGIDKKEFVAEAEQLHVDKASAEHAAEDLEKGLADAGTYALIAYAPAALLAVIGIFGLVLNRTGRLAGVFAVLLGGASGGVWALLSAAAGAAHPSPNAPTVSLAIGAHLLLVAAIVGGVAGPGAVVSPDRG